MENNDQYVPVTDNTLLPFGEFYRMPRESASVASGYIDFSSIFENGITMGNATHDIFRVSSSGTLVFRNEYGTGSHLYILRARFDAQFSGSPDEDAGVYVDLNEERDSIVVTWNKIGLYVGSPEPTYSFQVEFVDEGNGNYELILRYADLPLSQLNNNIRLFGEDVVGAPDLNQLYGPTSELDTVIGNTGVAGVFQYNLVRGQLVGDTITGTDGDDVLEGTEFSDVIDGGAGNDTIDALSGSDDVRGAEGDDVIQSLAPYGNNQIDGGAGDDTIRTGDSNDTIIGGDGDDLINAGFGANVIMAGNGNDIIRFGYEGRTTVTGGGGDDSIDGSFLNESEPWLLMETGHHELNGGDGNDTILGTNDADLIGGQDGNDSVLAGGGYDTIFGGEGNDILTGGQHDDVIDGGAGDDFIFGALGNDTATGGEGRDRFFNSGQRGDVLHITDYNRDEGDFLVLDGDLFDRAQIALRYEVTATEASTDITKLRIGIMEQDNFRALFTFGNVADLDEVLLRLPADEGAPVAPILFDLGDLMI